MRAPLTLVFLAVFFTGCITNSMAYRDDRTPIDQRVVVLSSAEVAERGLKGEPLSMPFADGSQGTQVMLDFFDAADQAGAKEMSDLEIQTTTATTGTCVLRIEPETDAQQAQPENLQPESLQPETGVTQSKKVMRPVSRVVTEPQIRCRMVSRPRTVTETVYESQYDPSTKKYRRVPRQRTRTEHRMQRECKTEPVTRRVTRYENQYESRFVPPQWDVVFSIYSSRKLIEAAPTCTPLVESATISATPHLVRAIIYR